MLTLAALLPLALPLDAPALDYTVRVDDPASETVEVRLELSGLEGPLELSLPERFAYVQLEEPRLERGVFLEAPGDGELLREGPFRWRLDPGSSPSATLSWRVPLDHRRLPAVAGRDEYEFPYLRDDHGLLVMGTLALAPAELQPSAARVRFALPAGWEVHAPWSAEADGSYELELSHLRDDLVAVGAWNAQVREVAGMQLTVAFAPGQEDFAARVHERIAPIVAHQLELFGSTPQDAYLFLFGEPQAGGYGGSPKTQSMTLFVDPELPLDFALGGVEHLIAHEFHHTWQRARCNPQPELRFVMEGFTDYYAWLSPWRLGTLEDAGLLEKLAELVAKYEQAQAESGLSLLEAGGPVFFEGGSAYRAVYAGGLTLALWLDLALRQANPPSDLLSIVRALYEDERWRDGDARPGPEDLWRLVEQAAGADIAQTARAWTQTAEMPALVERFGALELSIEREEVPAALDLRANMDGRTLVAIDPSDASALVGLRAGDELLRVNGVDVASEEDVRRAWGRLVDGRIQVRFRRAGEERARAIDAARPAAYEYALPAELLERLR